MFPSGVNLIRTGSSQIVSTFLSTRKPTPAIVRRCRSNSRSVLLAFTMSSLVILEAIVTACVGVDRVANVAVMRLFRMERIRGSWRYSAITFARTLRPRMRPRWMGNSQRVCDTRQTFVARVLYSDPTALIDLSLDAAHHSCFLVVSVQYLNKVTYFECLHFCSCHNGGYARTFWPLQVKMRFSSPFSVSTMLS